MSDASAEHPWPITLGAPPGTTYARARLRLGIACVGTFVVLAALLWATDAPGALLPDSRSWAWTDPLWIAALVALHAAVSAPFDRLGGVVLPRRYGRPVARGYARGVAAQAGALLVAALVLLAAGRAGGDGAVLVAVAALMLGMLAAQVPIARLVGGVRRSGERLVAPDPSFVGGIVGLPGRERILTPAAWDAETDRVQRIRREAVRASGSRLLGVAVAMAFTLAGVATALVTGAVAVTSVAGVAELALWMTLWSFLGLLVLPSLSRPAVVAADRAARQAGVGRDDLVRVLRTLDASQEDEPRRRPVVEAVFHPVPSLENRLAALAAPGGPGLPRPWNTARAALFLSWAGLGLLSRAVHCNCGRPALWVLLPGD